MLAHSCSHRRLWRLGSSCHSLRKLKRLRGKDDQGPNLHHHWFVSRVRIRGFKSFGDSSWSDIPLGRSAFLVGVVGGNGCGKSNLLDSLCFASGCQPASLRVRTLKDVANMDGGHARVSDLPGLG